MALLEPNCEHMQQNENPINCQLFKTMTATNAVVHLVSIIFSGGTHCTPHSSRKKTDRREKFGFHNIEQQCIGAWPFQFQC